MVYVVRRRGVVKHFLLNLVIMKGKNILYIVHAWIDNNNPGKTSLGGTTMHVMDLIDSLKFDNNCFVLTVTSGYYHLYSYIGKKVTDYNLGIKTFDYMFSNYNDQYKKMLSEVIEKFAIDIVHIHHLLGHYYDCVDVLKQKNIKTIVTIHDYFMICPQVNLLYKEKDYCGDRTFHKCAECLKGKNIDFRIRKSKIEELLMHAIDIIVPNDSVTFEFKKVYPKIEYKLIEHGIDLKDSHVYYKKNGKKLNVAFVGVMNYIKGAEVCKQIISSNSKNIDYHFFGVSADKFFLSNKHNYTYHGEYVRNDIVSKLRKYDIDVVCLLTICPETFCYTMSEVLAAKIPIIGFDIGAIGNRIKKYDCGWVIPIEEKSNGVISKLNYLSKNRNEIRDKANNILNLKMVTVEEMVCNTNNLYYKALPNLAKKKNKNYDSIIKHSFKNSYKTNIYDNEVIILMKKIYRYAKKKTPYFIKRPIYLVIKKVLKRGN